MRGRDAPGPTGDPLAGREAEPAHTTSAKEPPSFLDPVEAAFSKYRPRLAAVIEGVSWDGRTVAGVVEFLDTGYRVQERLTFQQIEDLGFRIRVQSYGVELQRNERRYVVTSWPIEPFGQVSTHTRTSPALGGS
jgi:hypothetical protein